MADPEKLARGVRAAFKKIDWSNVRAVMTENRYLENVAGLEATGSALDDIEEDKGEVAADEAMAKMIDSIPESRLDKLAKLIADRKSSK